MNSEDRERKGSSLDRQLDALLAQSMKVSVPETLIHRTMRSLPETQAAPFPWWAWLVYGGFFTATLLGLIYGQREALAMLATEAALAAPRVIVLAAEYPYLVAAVTGAFLINAVLAWFFTADVVLRKRTAGVVPV